MNSSLLSGIFNGCNRSSFAPWWAALIVSVSGGILCAIALADARKGRSWIRR